MDRKKKYEKKRTVKPVSILNEEDSDILEYTKNLVFSTYIKKLIREEMRK